MIVSCIAFLSIGCSIKKQSTPTPVFDNIVSTWETGNLHPNHYTANVVNVDIDENNVNDFVFNVFSPYDLGIGNNCWIMDGNSMFEYSTIVDSSTLHSGHYYYPINGMNNNELVNSKIFEFQ